MKMRFFNLLIMGIASALLLTCCKGPVPEISSVAITVVVPIHPTSLEYFDYLITYQDNTGCEIKDTVRTSGGIVVDDYRRASKKQSEKMGVPDPKGSINNNNCYVRTFYYDSFPVSCSAKVELVPITDSQLPLTCYFYIPKPYIFPSIYFNHSAGVNPDPNISSIEGIESIWINEMSLSEFLSTYGSVFLSHANVCQMPNGDYDVQFY